MYKIRSPSIREAVAGYTDRACLQKTKPNKIISNSWLAYPAPNSPVSSAHFSGSYITQPFWLCQSFGPGISLGWWLLSPPLSPHTSWLRVIVILDSPRYLCLCLCFPSYMYNKPFPPLYLEAVISSPSFSFFFLKNI